MKVSPAQLVYGNAVNLDRGILIPFDETQLTTDAMTASSSKMQAQQKDVMRIAQQNLMLSDSTNNANIAQSTDKITEFEIGSHMLALPRQQPKTILHTLWTGPYRVLETEGGKYQVLDLITNKSKMYLVTQLNEFHYDNTRTEPTDIARRDHHEFCHFEEI